MKYLRSLLIFSFGISSLTGCSHKDEKIIRPEDYAVYLNRDNDKSWATCNEELRFWRTKLSEVPESETYRAKVAGLLSSRFMLNGRIEDIHSSDSLYNLIIANTQQKYASLHRALAGNAITQHQFRKAKKEIETALEIGEGKASSLFMLVDVNMELGDYAAARMTMKEFRNKNFHPYIIRQAKLEDHEGRLDSAIVMMETALDKVKDNPTLTLWTRSNLADMYGHAGRIEEAYANYLAVLKQNPDYYYALKGIAWIAFSHDHNYAEAKHIVHAIRLKRATPDMHLLLAEIADCENDQPEKEKQLSLFVKEAADPKYGDMYNKYLARVEAEELSNAKRAIEIAHKEIENRPTPQSYDLLAWGHMQNGNMEEALAIAQQHIEGKTYEPDAFYHLGVIYSANGNKGQARRYFEEAAQSAFELGPKIASQIEKQLN
ncbi:tetratricopeptide repeat protein [Chryseolinea sp. T2]|uniref:tetratricopeptide repeat protein n=1 Tax=Chryseolinea sp. T2 TaxID=3129255 RepID=UPI003076DBE2